MNKLQFLELLAYNVLMFRQESAPLLVFTDISEHTRFLLLSFLYFHFLSVGSVQ